MSAHDRYAPAHGLCYECDDPVAVYHGWYRCRSCGYESVQSNTMETMLVGLSDPCGLTLSPTQSAASVSPLTQLDLFGSSL